MLAETLDPDGRRVVLTEERWRQHILKDHPRLAPHMRSVMAAVREPDRRLPGRVPGEEWFYLAAEEPGEPWLKVVVHYEDGRGSITTAFPRRSFP